MRSSGVLGTKRRLIGAAAASIGLLAATGGVALANGNATSSTTRPAPNLAPAQGKVRVARHTLFSSNWSGYVALNDTFSDVKGSWTQPAANCAGIKGRKTTIASFWVGLDGWNSKTVEQTGVDTDCVGSTPFYQAWAEFFPAGVIPFGDTVTGGDSMSAEVSQDGTTVTTTLTDHTQGWTETQTHSAAGLAFNSAEWIGEAPTRSLTNFGSVDFTSASATDTSNNTGPIDATSWSSDSVTMVTSRGGRFHFSTRAEPGALTDTGSPTTSAFTDTWQHS